MKKFTLISVAILIVTLIFAQVPQAFNYQAIARDGSGNPTPDQNIGIRVTLTNGNGGSVLYQETQNATTNQFGLFILNIGNGTPVTGIFTDINWAMVTPWMQVEIDPAGGSAYIDMGSSQLLSVPYSLFAADGNPGPEGPQGPMGPIGPAGPQGPPGSANISGTTNYIVKFTGATTGSDSQIYDNGNSIGINTTAPSGKLNIKGSSNTSQLLIDANNIQSNTNPLVKLRSSSGADLMWINSDNPANTFIGFNAGRVNDAAGGGTGNSFTGRDAGYSNTTGYDNTANGYQALFTNSTGHSNTAIGELTLYLNVTGNYNTASGRGALYSNTTGNFNTGNGSNTLFLNSTGSSNTASGWGALASNTTGSFNTANGFASQGNNTIGTNNTSNGCQSLFSNTIGNYNTADGYQALYSNTLGSKNTADGHHALYLNTEGNENVAIGYLALDNNTTGDNNIAGGSYALFSNTTASFNSAIGHQALYSNVSGFNNSAFGAAALYSNTDGDQNTSVGNSALFSNTTGGFNIAMGGNALFSNISGSNNTAIGCYASYYSLSGFNTSIGFSAGDFYTITNGTFAGYNAHPNADGFTNITGLGYNARPIASNQVRIGNSAVTSIGGYAGWTNLSDERFKQNVKEDVKGLEFILKLRPVTYNYAVNDLAVFLKEDDKRDMEGNINTHSDIQDKTSRDAKEKIRYTGFFAREVEAAAQSVGFIFSGVDAPKNNDDLYGLRYAEFVVPLVKAVQEQQVLINEILSENAELLERIEKLEKK